MTEQTGPDESAEAGVVRQQSFDVDGAIDVDLSITTGRVEVRLVDEPGAHVEVRHDPGAGNAWAQGVSNLIGWVAGQFGEPSQPATPADAVRKTRIDLTGQRLVIAAPKALPLRAIPLAVVVRAPQGSRIDVHSGSADVTITGSAARVDVHSGSGDITVDRCDGSAKVQTGSGAVRLGPMFGGVNVRSGSGDIEVSSVGGATALNTGSGDVWLGAVAGDVMVRTGSGDLTVADAASGDIELFTGSGEIRVGVRAGSGAEVDLRSGSGQARSELDLADTPPEDTPALRVRGKTGSGNALVTTATT